MASPQARYIHMEELLDNLMKKSKDYLEVVTNLKKEKIFDRGTWDYLHQVMEEMERDLHEHKSSYNLRAKEQKRPDPSHSRQRPVPPGGMLPPSARKGGAEYGNNAERLKGQLEDARNEIDRIKRAADHDMKLLRETEVKLKKSEKEKSDYIARFSKLASDRLTLGNPDVTDLSDPNRPTKLSEIYKEVYDNEWTEAYEVLTGEGRSELETISILRVTLQEAVDFSREKAGKLLKITEKTVNSLFEDYGQTLQRRKKASNIGPGSQTVGGKGSTEGLVRDVRTMDMVCVAWEARTAGPSTTTPGGLQAAGTLVNKPNIMQHVKTLRKEIAYSLIPTVQKAYLKPRWTQQCHAVLKPFIRKCIYVGWLMCVQDPPMVLMETNINTDHFDKAYYTYYDKIGSLIDYVVWPPMLIQERGALLCKGVAQGKQ